MFRLKEPDVGLARGYFNLSRYYLHTMLGCLERFWLSGLVMATRLYINCLVALPRVRAARARHFDATRKLNRPV
jgi:hypothetical protein